MPRLRVHCFGTSLDGYGAGPDQSLENPMGAGGLAAYCLPGMRMTFFEIDPAVERIAQEELLYLCAKL
ncbi:MAG TPA: hypothetical protein VD971_06310 [Phycisphaerales bacterium]|nr:hypothetical protein [Phycisphaerales bacterium]